MLECAPFARALSGVDLRGPAADWWQNAAGRYARSSRPAVGAVLAFRRTSRLRDGHAAVVSRVMSERTILVTQANWVPHRVTQTCRFSEFRRPTTGRPFASGGRRADRWKPPLPDLGLHPARPPAVRDALEASMQEVLGSHRPSDPAIRLGRAGRGREGNVDCRTRNG
jgi:surface antigen